MEIAIWPSVDVGGGRTKDKYKNILFRDDVVVCCQVASNPCTMRPLLLLAITLLPSVSLAAQSATVYLQPPPSQEQNVPALEPYEANSVLANYLGLRRTIFGEIIEDVMRFGSEEWEHLWQPVHPVENTIGAGPYDRLMLFIQSDHPEGEHNCELVRFEGAHAFLKDFVSLKLKPTFTISDAPKSAHFEELLDTYISQAHNVFDEVITSVLNFTRAPSQPAELPSYKRFLDIFDLTPSESTVLFMDELRALVSMADSPNEDENEIFTALKLDGLFRIAREHGRASEVYTTAAQSLRTILSHVRPRPSIASSAITAQARNP
jgi:hypothetical protein